LGCVLLLVQTVAGCGSSVTSFIHPDVDFGHIQRCALLPFQNLSSDAFAGDRMQSIFLMEVLKHGSLALVDPEEAVNAMKDLRIAAGTNPTPEQIVALGKALSVEAVFMGTVEEYGLSDRARDRFYYVTATFSMVETETGNTIWRSQVHRDGSSLWAKLFGGESASLYEVSRKAVQAALGSLF
jgi:hypothetical protein